MPPFRFWMVVLRAFVVGAAGVLMTQLVTTPLTGTSWLLAGLTGAVAAGNAGHAAWPESPPPSARVPL